MAHTIVEEVTRSSGGGSSSSNLCRPYRKMPFPGREERGWLEASFRLGLAGCPQFCLAKTVTKSDADRAQHRYQLTTNDVKKAMPLWDIVARVMDVNSLAVNVLDRAGRKYAMDFKYIASTGYFRFMGDGWTEFLDRTKLEEKQTMTIWRLYPRTRGEYWFVFVNSDDDDEKF